jgi:hypothetical protein
MKALRKLWTVTALLVVARPAAAAELTPATTQAFDAYVNQSEACISSAPPVHVKDQKPVIRPGECRGPAVTGGSVQNWTGRMFIPGATIQNSEMVLQDYDNYKKIYPEVIESRNIARDGNTFEIFLRLNKSKYVISALLNTTHHVIYEAPDDRHLRITSRSVRIAEADKSGHSGSGEKPVGNDNGFLWRINNYWELETGDGGVYVTCRAISLSREIPPVLAFLIQSKIDNFSKDTLRDTMVNTATEIERRVRDPHVSRPFAGAPNNSTPPAAAPQ